MKGKIIMQAAATIALKRYTTSFKETKPFADFREQILTYII